MVHGGAEGAAQGQARRRAKELLELVGLSQAAKGKIKTYSGGMKQRLALPRLCWATRSCLFWTSPQRGWTQRSGCAFVG